MFSQLVSSSLDAASLTPAPASSILPVSPGAAWSLILLVLGFSAVALWILRDNPPVLKKPSKPPTYRKAA
jgi:hypothetical protein